ncbi:hypothetical protein ElyMa_004074600 [Elysia marginata]|uniref:Uncharacterized protein n=1 Tax=Elysia marginata TaxID=1093978 RepID=A0AAV4G7Y7_9GAST|nr:hypothetical protein ElyMa_004074600 [Elysia marginata]
MSMHFSGNLANPRAATPQLYVSTMRNLDLRLAVVNLDASLQACWRLISRRETEQPVARRGSGWYLQSHSQKHAFLIRPPVRHIISGRHWRGTIGLSHFKE